MKINPKQYGQNRMAKAGFGGKLRGLLSLGILSLSLPVSAVVWPQPESAYHSTQRHPQWIEPPKLTQSPTPQMNSQGVAPQNGFLTTPVVPPLSSYGGYRQPSPMPYYGEYAGRPYPGRARQSSGRGFPNFGHWNMPNTMPSMPSIPSMSAPSFNFPSFGW